MAITVYESARQLPCHVEDGGVGGGKVCAEQPVVQDDDQPERLAIWNMIQSQKPAVRQLSYVHPLVRRSSSLLSQKSLEICTESLGSETGSDGFSDADGSCPGSDDDCEDASGKEGADAAAAQAPPARSFPPPLPSLARRAVGSLQMRPHRLDGRLVVEAVPVPSATMFRARRRGGRLLLSFADAGATDGEEEEYSQEREQVDHEDDHDQETGEEDGEEVEVVDRGTVVEVKVSTQPQAHSSGARVHRSLLVINKFVGAEPLATGEIGAACAQPPPPPRRPSGSTTTAAAAVAAASALSAASSPEDGGAGESKLLVTAGRRCSKEELLNQMRRCEPLRGQLFIWEPWGIATSS